jgi:hypothetical protein
MTARARCGGESIHGTSFRGLSIVTVTEAGLLGECSPAQRMRMVNDMAVFSNFQQEECCDKYISTLNKRK